MAWVEAATGGEFAIDVKYGLSMLSPEMAGTFASEWQRSNMERQPHLVLNPPPCKPRRADCCKGCGAALVAELSKCEYCRREA
jgi:hypothetical protein